MNIRLNSVEDLRALSLIPQCIMLWDRSLCCIGINQRTVYNLFGLESGFVENQFFGDLPLSRDMRAAIRRSFDLARASGRKAELQQTLYIDNQRVELESIVQPMFEDEELTGFITICHRSQTARSQGEQVWSMVYARSEELFFCLDPNGHVLRGNHDFAGLSAQEWHGRKLAEVFNPADLPAFEQGMRRALDQGEMMQFEVVRRDTWFRVTLTPWLDGQRPSGVLVRLDDVTRDRQRQLIEEGRHALLNDALSGVEEAVFLLHVSGNIVFRNRSAMRLLSEMPRTATELAAHLKGRAFHEDGSEVREPESLGVFTVLKGGSPARERFILKKGAQLMTLESSARALERGGSAGVYTLWIVRDVTDEAQTLEGLREVNSRMDAFVRTAAHDLRTPVSNLHNLSTLLLRAETTEAKNALARRISESTNVLTQLLESLMQLAEVRAGEHTEGELFTVEPILDGVLTVLHDELLAAEAHVTKDLKVTEFHFYPGYFRSIVFNLVTNAVKYRSSDRPLELSIVTREAVNGMWLEVADNGIGIDLQNDQDDLFRPFRRLTSQSQGKGIGLSLVKLFVEQNGGEVVVESRPGHGSVFKLLIRTTQPDENQITLFD